MTCRACIVGARLEFKMLKHASQLLCPVNNHSTPLLSAAGTCGPEKNWKFAGVLWMEM